MPLPLACVCNDVHKLEYNLELCVCVCYDMAFSLQGGMTPLIWATLAGHVECIKVLLDWGAQTNNQDKVSAQTNTYSVDMLPSVEDT